MSDCVFCAIIEGKAGASFIHRTHDVAAFLDIHPINPGHTLIVPNTHAARLSELAPMLGAEMFRLGQRVAAALYASDLRCEGVNFFLADGEAATQDVFHVHLHVIPRYEGDGFGLKLPEGYQNVAARSALEKVAADLNHHL